MRKCLHVWEAELAGDPDKDFILSGLRLGFSLVDYDVQDIPQAFTKNHASVRQPHNKQKVHDKIIAELLEGNYMISQQQPRIVSALAAIDKPDGGIRLIHDLSRPKDQSLNDYAFKDECTYTTLTDALSQCHPDTWLAKIDLSNAFRSIPIKPEQWTITGLQWQFNDSESDTFMMDKRLPFGARKSPAIYNRITKAIQRMMQHRNFKVRVYLDDFLVIGDNKEECTAAFNCLIALLRKLGLSINWNKVIDPCQCLTFLGVQIDINNGTLKLDPPKAFALCNLISDTLCKKRLSKKQLQSLAGKLMWATNVHHFGKTFINTFFDAIQTLKMPHHKIRITDTMFKDLKWWLNCLESSINTKLIWDKRPCISIHTDSSQVSGGAFCQTGDWTYDWTYINWLLDRPHLAGKHINTLELAMVSEAIKRWAPAFNGMHMDIYTDSFVSVCAINKQRSVNSTASWLLRNIANTALYYNITITAHFVTGVNNCLADSVSRLHAPGQAQRFSALLRQLQNGHPHCFWLPHHMSPLSLTFISPVLQELASLWTNSIWR